MRRFAPLVLLALAAGCYQQSSKPVSSRPSGTIKEGIQVGNRAPEIQAEDGDGVSFKLSDYRGKVVLLDFWKER
jgi:hypothetical protein